MAIEKYHFGIKSVKFGTPTGSDTMPASVTAWAQTVRGTLTVSEDAAQLKQFNVEEATSPVKQIVTNAGALKIKWRAYDMTPELVAVVKGGTAGTGTGTVTYKGPVSVEAKELALEITTNDDVVWSIFKASVIARFDGSMSAESILEMEVEATALDPGNGSNPYMYEAPNPA